MYRNNKNHLPYHISYSVNQINGTVQCWPKGGSLKLAQSELTKEIKRALRNYNPIMNSNNRTIRWAEEVDVGTGYVDQIRFEDYITNINDVYECLKYSQLIDVNKPLCKKATCVGCVLKSSKLHQRILGIACTCFEIKISKSDFKSHNGHNFVGNLNYYVVPKELYPGIITLVPEDIGIITYAGHGSLRKRKECIRREIAPNELNRYLYNAMKKWCDLDYFKLEKFFLT